MGITHSLRGSKGATALFLVIFAVLLASCSPFKKLNEKPEQLSKKEIRKQNRAARKVQDAIKIHPGIVKGREIDVPVTLTAPERNSIIKIPATRKYNQDSLAALIIATPAIAPQILEKACDTDWLPYEDGHVKGKGRILNGKLDLDIKSKKQDVRGTAKAKTDTINPVEHKPLPPKWYETFLMWTGSIALLVLLFILAMRIITKRLNHF